MESAAAFPPGKVKWQDSLLHSTAVRCDGRATTTSTKGGTPDPPSSGREKTFNFVMRSSLESCNLLRDVN